MIYTSKNGISLSGLSGTSLSTTETGVINGSYGNLCGVSAGDVLLSSYWGIAMNLNWANLGDDSINATQTKINGTSSFTINTRSSVTAAFDKTLFVVRNSGNVGIGITNPAYKLDLLDTTGSGNEIGRAHV